MGIYNHFKNTISRVRKIERIRNSFVNDVMNIDNDEKYHFLKSKFVLEKMDSLIECNNVEELGTLYNLYRRIDQVKPIVSSEVGNYFEHLCNRQDIRLGIYHLKNYSGLSDENTFSLSMLQSIFENGLINYVDLSSTIHKVDNLYDMLYQVKSIYRGDIGIIVAFPQYMIDSEFQVKKGYENQIYDLSLEHPIIKTNYLLGYVTQNSGMCIYHPKEDLIYHQYHRSR